MTYRVESLMSARLFMVPQYAGKRVYFLSNLSGHLSLYSMKFGGSVPMPLLPPHIALQNPHFLGGLSFYVFPKLDQILVMIDKDGDGIPYRTLPGTDHPLGTDHSLTGQFSRFGCRPGIGAGCCIRACC